MEYNYIALSLERIRFIKTTTDVYTTLCQIQRQCVKEKLFNLDFSAMVTRFLISLQRHSELCGISLHIFNYSGQGVVHYFIKNGGFEYLMQIINGTLSDVILNQACILLRKLVSYTRFITNFDDITATRAIPSVVEFLARTKNIEFQNTACHTLMILANIPKIKQSILRENGIDSVTKLLHSSNTKLLLCSIKTYVCLTMAHSMLGFFPDLKLTSTEVSMIEILLEFMLHSKESVQNYALFRLMELSYRRDIVGFEVVTGFVKSLYACKSLELKRLVLHSLRRCFENWNMWKHHQSAAVYCLKHLVNFLHDKMFIDIHAYILELLECISSNCEITEILLDFGLLETSMNMLKEFTQQNKCSCFSENPKIQSSDECSYDEFVERCLFKFTESSISFGDLNIRKTISRYKALRKDKSYAFKLFKQLLFGTDLTFDDSDIFTFDDCLLLSEIKYDFLTFQSLDKNVISLLNTLRRLDRVKLHLIQKSNYTILLEYAYFISIDCKAWSPVEIFSDLKNGYFVKLILNGFVLELARFLPDGQYRRDAHCSSHSRHIEDYLNHERTSNLVLKLYYLLITCKESDKLLVMNAISRYVMSERYLKIALNELDGLQILIKCMGNKGLENRKIASVTIREIYNSLKNTFGSCLESQNSDSCMFYSESVLCCYGESDFDVKFLVDSGEKVSCNRELICKRSEYFNVLLGSDFVEGGLNTVSLHDISNSNILSIFHFLHGCGPSSSCNYIKDLPFSHLLELLADSDKFILTKLKKVIEIEVQHHLSYLNIPKVYEYAKMYNSPYLAKKALQMALDKPDKYRFPPDEWWNCFDELLNLDLSLNLFNDLENLMTKLTDTVKNKL